MTSGCDPTDHKKRGGACAATCIEVVLIVVRAIQSEACAATCIQVVLNEVRAI
jgi:hypothetical protein